MLTTKQIAFFQEHGYLILKNLIDPETIEEWRTQVWSHFNSSFETPETWPNDYEIPGFTFSPAFGHLPVMQRVAEAARWRTIFYRRWRLTDYQMAQP